MKTETTFDLFIKEKVLVFTQTIILIQRNRLTVHRIKNLNEHDKYYLRS